MVDEPVSWSGPVSSSSPIPNRTFTPRLLDPAVNATETCRQRLVRSCPTGQSEQMTEPWIRGCVVQRIMFRDGLVLNLDDNELVISAAFHLTLPTTGQTTKRPCSSIRNPSGPRTVRSSTSRDRRAHMRAGTRMAASHLLLSDGHEIHAHSAEQHTHGSCTANCTAMRHACRAATSGSSGTTFQKTSQPNASDCAQTDRRVFESAW